MAIKKKDHSRAFWRCLQKAGRNGEKQLRCHRAFERATGSSGVALRGLRGSSHHHHAMATYELKRLTSSRVDRMTCGEAVEAMFTIGRAVVHASESNDARLYKFASARRDQIFDRVTACGFGGSGRRNFAPPPTTRRR